MTDAEDLWQFSLDVYRRPGVADQCIRLQDAWQVNVNIVLWLLWLTERKQQSDETVILQAQSLVLQWQHQVTQPLRLLRRQLRHLSNNSEHGETFAAAYEQAKTVELESERVEQRQLARLTPSLSLAAISAGADGNVARYLRMLKVPQEEQQLLLDLLQLEVGSASSKHPAP